MKVRIYHLFVMLAVTVNFPAVAQMPTIISFNVNGVLVCSNLTPNSIAAVAWAPSPLGPWSTNLAGLNPITVAANGSIRVNLPVVVGSNECFRVLGVPTGALGMALIPAGSFTMGSTVDSIPNAVPTNVYVSAFFMDTNLVSYGLWQSVFNYATNNDYVFDDVGSALNNETNEPIQTVNWYDAVKWCNARSQQTGLTPVYYTDLGFTHIYTNGDTDAVYPNWTADGYQLPTEAQWEKAARGGLSGQRFPWGNTISESQANYQGNTNLFAYDLGPNGYNTNFDNGAGPSATNTSPVGYFPPNGYGLYDMAGNVQEWCWDWYNTTNTAYGQPTTNNPTGVPFGSYRIQRGGYWNFYALVARTAYRLYSSPGLSNNITGFRCVKTP